MPKAHAISAVTDEGVASFLAKIPEPALGTLLVVRASIVAAIEQAAGKAPAEPLKEELGYGVPAFRCGELVAGYSAGKRFCSYYPMSGRVITMLAADLEGYETTSGAIHFGIDKPLPRALVSKLVKARWAEIEAKKR